MLRAECMGEQTMHRSRLNEPADSGARGAALRRPVTDRGGAGERVDDAYVGLAGGCIPGVAVPGCV